MATLESFFPQISIDIPSVPEPLMARALRQAAIDFCEYTFTWRVELTAQNIVAGTRDYTLTPPACSRIVTVIYAGHDGTRILPTTMREQDDMVQGWRDTTNGRAAVSAHYYLPDRETIRLVLTPSEAGAGALALFVALKPTQDACEFPDILYDDNLEAIGHGALARLMAIPGKDWTNPDLALYHGELFMRAKRTERAERWNDYTRTSTLTVRPPNYYGPSRRAADSQRGD